MPPPSNILHPTGAFTNPQRTWGIVWRERIIDLSKNTQPISLKNKILTTLIFTSDHSDRLLKYGILPTSHHWQ